MVKITFKTLQQKQFFIQAEPEETILDVKKKIESEQGFPSELQKIIFSGKVLADDKTVGDSNFKEKDFCVVMVAKAPKPAAAPVPVAAPVASTSSNAPPSTPAQAPTTLVAPDAPRPSTSSELSSVAETPSPALAGEVEAPSTEVSSFLKGSQLQVSIDEMVNMGFPKEDVMIAMRASFNNPHRAVEYLMNGIPDSARQAPPPAAAQAPGTPSPASTNPSALTNLATPAPVAPIPGSRNLFEAAAHAAANPPAAAVATGATGAAATLKPGTSGLSANQMEQLRNAPIFTQLRSLVRQNPALLQPFLQELGRSNPELLSLIEQNQTAFISFLQEGDDGEPGGEDLMGQFGDMGEEGEDGSQYIQVTEEEKAAIERLESMGFDKQMVLQAYLACDRNEELAANYLIEHGMADGEDF